MADYFAKYCDESLQIRKLRRAIEDKNTMPLSKKTNTASTRHADGRCPGTWRLIGV
jgi:hypothetical protein